MKSKEEILLESLIKAGIDCSLYTDDSEPREYFQIRIGDKLVDLDENLNLFDDFYPFEKNKLNVKQLYRVSETLTFKIDTTSFTQNDSINNKCYINTPSYKPPIPRTAASLQDSLAA